MKKALITKDGKIVIYIPIGYKLKYLEGMKKTNLNPSDFLMHLLDNYEGDSLEVLKNYRYNLSIRIKKGINIFYINELKKIKELIDPIISRLC